MFLFEIEGLFNSESSSRGFSELARQVSESDSRANEIMNALQNSINNNIFGLAKGIINLFVNNLSIFNNNGISFARFVSNLSNFVSLFDHIRLKDHLNLEGVDIITLQRDERVLKEVEFVCKIIAASYTKFIESMPDSHLGTGIVNQASSALRKNVMLGIKENFHSPLCAIMYSIAESSFRDKTKKEFSIKTSKMAARLAKLACTPINSALKNISSKKAAIFLDRSTNSTDLCPTLLDMPTPESISAEKDKPICDSIDIFVSTHVRGREIEGVMDFARLYRASIEAKSIDASSASLSKLMYEASIVLAQNRSTLPIKLTA